MLGGRARTRGQGSARGRGRGCTMGRGHATGGSGVQGARRGCGVGRGHGSGRTRSGTGVIDGIDMIKWKKAESEALCYTYRRTPGPITSLGSDATPRELFCRFFIDEVWDLMVTETDRYASELKCLTHSTR